MSTEPPCTSRFSALVDVHHYPPSPEARTVKRRYEEIFGARPKDRGGWYHPADWGRTSYVLSRLSRGTAFLDVGVGAGQFVNMVAASCRFDNVSALDPTRFNKYTELTDDITRIDHSIVESDLPDDEFDTVTCMEVLEHIPSEIFDSALSELRRLCRGKLLMTVPFEEPPPLSRGHVRRFTRDDIEALFPEAHCTILDRPRRPWVLLEEWLGPGDLDVARIDCKVQGGQIAALEERIARLESRPAMRATRWAEQRARDTRGLAKRVLRRG